MSTSLGAWALLDSGALSSRRRRHPGDRPDPAVARRPDRPRGHARPTSRRCRPSVAQRRPSRGLGSSGGLPGRVAGGLGRGRGRGGRRGRTAEQAAALQAWIAIPQPVMAWRVVDQFARIIGGGELATGPLPEPVAHRRQRGGRGSGRERQLRRHRRLPGPVQGPVGRAASRDHPLRTREAPVAATGASPVFGLSFGRVQLLPRTFREEPARRAPYRDPTVTRKKPQIPSHS